MDNQKTKAKPKNRSLFPIIVAVIFGSFCLCLILGVIVNATPSGKATSTAREVKRNITQTYQALPTTTETLLPTKTPTQIHTVTVTTIPATPTVTLTSTKSPYAYVTVIKQSINLRAGPGTNYKIVGNVKQGDKLPVYARSEDGLWFQISIADYVWVSTGLVELDGETSNIPVAPTPTITNTPTDTKTPEPTATITPKPSSTSTATNTPTTEPQGLTDWLEYEGVRVRVVNIAWDKYIGYSSAESGKIYLSIYIVVVNNTDRERIFTSSDFSVIDGSGTVNSANWFVVKEPEFEGCTIVPGGTCEGWWTSEVLDLPNVHENLIFRWDTGWFSPDLETPINQEE